jgi:hypothetical protein
MEQLKMAPMRAKYPYWIWNRSDTHMFLKVPEAHDAFTTVVEAGNSFSPGPGSYGVSSWIYTEGKLYAPELCDLKDIAWEFEGKKYPVSNACWRAGSIQVNSSLFTLQNGVLIDYRDYLRISISNKGHKDTEADFYLVIRSFGAAGGPVERISENNSIVSINSAPLIYCKTRGQFGAVSYSDEGKDICEYLVKGELPGKTTVVDTDKWASGALCYHCNLKPGNRINFDFVFHLHAETKLLEWLKPVQFPLDFDKKKEALKKHWDSITGIKFSVPDNRVSDTFFAQINHLYMTAGLEAPHISCITYPTWWMRDSAYICTALDQAGLHDFSARAATHAGRYKVSAPFGPEADLQGSRIWVISEHYLLTRDADFLKQNYHYITENAEEIIKMCNTDIPLYFFSESFTHESVNKPELAFTCGTSQNGICRGRMDFHFPLFYCNGFCYLGLYRAQLCAEALGNKKDVKRFGTEAAKLKKAMLDFVPGHFTRQVDNSGNYIQDKYNIYDTGTVFFPCGWGDLENEDILKEYENYWNNYLCPQGKIHHEPLWTYLEMCDTRNRLILGQRERVWKVLEHFFNNQSCPGMYTWHEGNKDENSNFLAWEKVRGWDKAPCVTPHGWIGSLMLGMMREIMVHDDEKGRIYLGLGVPKEWADKGFYVENMPTYYGNISYRYIPEKKTILVSLEKTAVCEIIACFPFDVLIEWN